MRLSFDARARALLRRIPVVNVYSLAELLLLGVLAVQCARLVWTVLTPVSPLGEWRPAGVTLPAAPGEVLRGFDPFYRISGVQTGPAVVTSLQLKLFGTRIDEAMGRGSAILAGPDGVQKSIAVGEEIIPGVVLKEVAFDHVSIERGGVREDLFLDQSGGAATPTTPGATGDAVAVPTGAMAGITAAQFQTEIGFVPRIEAGRISGLVVRPEGSGTAFRTAGLREGDIVTAIGGRPVQGPADIERLATQYATGGTIALTVDRGGQSLPLSVQVAGQ
ncbi:type II secretion system protein N [Sphingomonas radiodurans]|uniref:type II secretion system protein N n=1 Tax=Sphingomonas radiodurans TaxID=2890321 RepID=UPI001E472256|nr:type II secretion system protein N [Sphingomonas radiodurans]WBH16287.1 PDZ domain-containing protein [Sphingomonas radiodurans]